MAIPSQIVLAFARCLFEISGNASLFCSNRKMHALRGSEGNKKTFTKIVFRKLERTFRWTSHKFNGWTSLSTIGSRAELDSRFRTLRLLIDSYIGERETSGNEICRIRSAFETSTRMMLGFELRYENSSTCQHYPFRTKIKIIARVSDRERRDDEEETSFVVKTFDVRMIDRDNFLNVRPGGETCNDPECSTSVFPCMSFVV